MDHFVTYILRLSLLCFLLCSLQPYDYLLGKADLLWFSCVWCFIVFVLLSHKVSRVRCGI